jgi:hypothetical protein
MLDTATLIMSFGFVDAKWECTSWYYHITHSFVALWVATNTIKGMKNWYPISMSLLATCTWTAISEQMILTAYLVVFFQACCCLMHDRCHLLSWQQVASVMYVKLACLSILICDCWFWNCHTITGIIRYNCLFSRSIQVSDNVSTVTSLIWFE